MDAIIVQGREAGGHVIGQVCALVALVESEKLSIHAYTLPDFEFFY